MTPIDQLRDIEKIQRESGNYNYNPYMHGMANGLILALAIMEEREPEYLETPERWLADLPVPEGITTEAGPV